MVKFPKWWFLGRKKLPRRRRTTLLGSLSNEDDGDGDGDGDGNENGKKAIGLY